MNKQIEQLYSQVGLDFENFQRVTVTKGDMEKFAELIVRECAELFPLTCHPLSGGAIQGTIKEHFGVEE